MKDKQPKPEDPMMEFINSIKYQGVDTAKPGDKPEVDQDAEEED